jgi:N-acetylglucosamine-6-sulfatase
MTRIAFGIALLWACSSSNKGDAGGDARATSRPNIIFILTDDLNVEVYGHMDRLKHALDDQGTSFRNHFLNISLCCPSRTAILRGQYAHNTHIFTNSPPNGGFETFFSERSEDQTVAVWLAAAGYRTALFGKYLNGYPNTASDTYIPPGWTEWASPVGGNPYSEYNYQLNDNGTVASYGPAPEDYMVDVLSRKAVDFIHRRKDEPFFLYLAPYAPHGPATPPPRYANDFPDAHAPRTPSFNEADVSDKPAWLQNRPPLTAPQILAIDALYRKRLQSMEAVEDLVDNVVAALTETGLLDRTYIVFTSDNGFHQGQHRLASGKNTEFDEDLFAPMIVRGPGVPAGRVLDHFTVNVDFAPTFVDLAGVAIPASVDGRSLAPLLGDDPPPPSSWRRAVFLEHAADVAEAEPVSGTREPPDEVVAAPAPPMAPPPFAGIRTVDWSYIEYSTGEKELYNHGTDPDQLQNLGPTADPTLLGALHSIVVALHDCQGDGCRSAETMEP